MPKNKLSLKSFHVESFVTDKNTLGGKCLTLVKEECFSRVDRCPTRDRGCFTRQVTCVKSDVKDCVTRTDSFDCL